MELFMALTIAAMFAGGTYLILRPNLIRVVMGLGLYSNAANLLMIVCGGYETGRAAPFMSETTAASSLMDPLPPDIILTAIVISFAVGALFLTTCYRVYLDHGTDNPEELPNHEDPEDDPAQQPVYDESSTADDADTPATGGVPDVIAEIARPCPDSPHEPEFDPARQAQTNH